MFQHVFIEQDSLRMYDLALAITLANTFDFQISLLSLCKIFTCKCFNIKTLLVIPPYHSYVRPKSCVPQTEETLL